MTHAPTPDDDEPTVPSDEDSEAEAIAAEIVDAADVPAALPVAGAATRPAGDRASPLAQYDPLAAYMRDVQRHPLLSPAEEKETAIRYYKTGDVDAAARLVTANLRLVVKIAYEYRRAHQNLPDLIQEGSIGLMQAVKKFDPYKGVKLSTYAAWWIRAYILRFILNNARLVKLGTTQAQRKLFFNLKKEKARLAALGIDPSPENIARRLGVEPDEVVQMDRRLSSGEASLDAPLKAHESDSPSRIEVMPGAGRDADDRLAETQINDMVTEKLHTFGEQLRGKEARIFHERLLADEPRTLQELGDAFGISRERVRQLEKRLQMKLKAYLAEELGEDAFTP